MARLRIKGRAEHKAGGGQLQQKTCYFFGGTRGLVPEGRMGHRSVSMNIVLRGFTIVSLLGLFLGWLVYLEPDILAKFKLNIWDGPRQLGNFNREKDRFNNLDDLKRKLAIRRGEFDRIVQAICKEEIGLVEAAVRVKALETVRKLPPLHWSLQPNETWEEKLHLWILERV